MKILLVYPGFVVREVPLNIMYVSAVMGNAGHQTALFHFSPYKKQSWTKTTAERIVEGFVRKMDEYKPDMVGFSVMIQDYNITKQLSGIARNRYKVPVIWGGIQPILQPEECINEPEVDFICTGEAENVIPEFLEKFQSGKDPLTVTGIWGKSSSGKITRTGTPHLVDDLDSVPFPNRDLMEPKYYRAELTGANILTARGCPFPCTFCQNKALMDIYKRKGKFVRYRSFDNVFAEMEYVIDKYQAPSFYFSDEMFTLNQERVLEFCQEYKKRINKPFMVQTRVDHMNEELAKHLADAGCFMVNMAIENGNENIRNVILKKKVSMEQVLAAYNIVHEHGMMSSSFNMLGVPGETMDTIRETIEVNRELKPHRVLCTIFMPLPGTALWTHCLENNLIDKNIKDTTNYYSEVAIKNPNIPPRTLIGYQGFFDWYVLLPKWTWGGIHVMRLIYQTIVPPKKPRTAFGRKIKELIVETVYQMKAILPQKKLHLKNR